MNAQVVKGQSPTATFWKSKKRGWLLAPGITYLKQPEKYIVLKNDERLFLENAQPSIKNGEVRSLNMNGCGAEDVLLRVRADGCRALNDQVDWWVGSETDALLVVRQGGEVVADTDEGKFHIRNEDGHLVLV